MTEQFFECQPKLIKQIASKLKEPSIREDILQETFLKFAQKFDTIESNDNLCGYLHRITENTIIDYYRRERRLVITDNDQILDKAVPASTLNEHILLADCCLGAFIDQLPLKYREAIILTDIEGKSQKEIATQLGVSYSGLKSRVQRARKMLKDAILSCCNYEFDKYGSIVSCKN